MRLIKRKKVTFLLSGGGSNLFKILKKNLTSKKFITLSIISDNQVSKQIKELLKLNDLDIKIYEKVSILKPKFIGNCDVIFSVGYLKKIESEIIKNYKIINIHPSLLPKFKGLNTFKRILKNKEKKTGCTVHFVNEKLDGGAKIIQKSFFINKNDNEETLKNKTQKLEHRAFSEAIVKIFRYN